MLVIRLNRVGRKNHVQYRLVVQEKMIAPGGKHLAVVGSYDPHSKKAVLKAEEIKTYINNGAQPSDSVYNLLVREGVIDGAKRFVKVPEKKVEEVEEKEEETTTDAPAEEEVAEEKAKEKEETSADEKPADKTEEVSKEKEEVAEEAPKEEEKEEKSTDKEEVAKEKKEEK